MPLTIDSGSFINMADDGRDRWISAPEHRFTPEFRQIAHNELDRLAALQPNWDCEGAPPIDPAIIQAARTLIDHLSDDLIRPPRVVPMSPGNLQFEWRSGERSLELEIEDPDTIHFLKWDRQYTVYR